MDWFSRGPKSKKTFTVRTEESRNVTVSGHKSKSPEELQNHWLTQAIFKTLRSEAKAGLIIIKIKMSRKP